jgi:hypothetical protein
MLQDTLKTYSEIYTEKIRQAWQNDKQAWQNQQRQTIKNLSGLGMTMETIAITMNLTIEEVQELSEDEGHMR